MTRYRKLAPGVYAGDDASLHLAIDELLEAGGYADTLENRNTVIDAAMAICDANGIDLDVDQ